MAVLPGLPGSLYPYVSAAERDEFLERETERAIEALSALTPWMVWRRDWWADRMRLPLELLPPIRLRMSTATAPDGLGEGVLLDSMVTGEFERVRSIKPRDERKRLFLPGDLPLANGPLQILPARLTNRPLLDVAEAARKFMEEHDG